MVLDVIFGFLLAFPPIVSVFIFGTIILIIINIFYKVLVDQEKATHMKQRQKELNAKMKKIREEGNQEKIKPVMSELMKEQQKLMKMNMKPMIVSFIIVIILLPWMHGVYGDQTVAGESFMFADEEFAASVDGDTATVEGQSCELPCTLDVNGRSFELSVSEGQLSVAPVIARLPLSVPLTGAGAGWLAWYIIISIPLSVLLRKFMKIQI